MDANGVILQSPVTLAEARNSTPVLSLAARNSTPVISTVLAEGSGVKRSRITQSDRSPKTASISSS
ncbi:MAG: hypothetical protein QMC00_02200, partial [Pseudomonadales bacterium]